jgi:hypothetical protein
LIQPNIQKREYKEEIESDRKWVEKIGRKAYDLASRRIFEWIIKVIYLSFPPVQHLEFYLLHRIVRTSYQVLHSVIHMIGILRNPT